MTQGLAEVSEWCSRALGSPAEQVLFEADRGKRRTDDERIGVDIVKRAVESPTRVLADNAGEEGSVIVQEVKKRKGNEGYNVSTGVYEDLVKAGVVDPKKVTRTALVTEIPKEKPTGSPSNAPGGMDY